MEGATIFGIVWSCLVVLGLLWVILCSLRGYIRMLSVHIWKMLYKIRVFHLLYYLIPDEFKNDPEEPLADQYLSDAVLCSCCNCSLLLYQLYHCWNRIVVDKFRALFNCLCGCIIVRRRTRNNNDNLELPISYHLPQQLPLQDNCFKSDTIIQEERLQTKKDEGKHSMCNNNELCPPEPVVFLTTSLRSAPMCATRDFHPSSSSQSSGTTVVTSGSSNNNVQDYAA